MNLLNCAPIKKVKEMNDIIVNPKISATFSMSNKKSNKSYGSQSVNMDLQLSLLKIAIIILSLCLLMRICMMYKKHKIKSCYKHEMKEKYKDKEK